MDGAVMAITEEARLFMPLDELVDKDKERARLQKELDSVKKDIAMINGKLSNEGFVAKAPAQVVENERQKLAKAQEKLQKIEESMNAL